MPFGVTAVGAFFVTRRKRNAHRRDIGEAAGEGAWTEGILGDRRLKIGHRQPRGGAARNPLYEVGLREEVGVRDCRGPAR